MPEVPHVRLGREADLVLVVPATADVLARAAHGVADDLLTATLLTARCPVMFVPAMHTEMWEHPATRDNVALLRSRGAVVTEPASGRLTGADTGKGRLADPAEIVDLARLLLASPDRAAARPGRRARRRVRRWHAGAAGSRAVPGESVVRQAGVRAGSGCRRARCRCDARRRAHASRCPIRPVSTLIRVGTALDMRDADAPVAAGADVVVMAAAVADFRPVDRADYKIKKTDRDPEPVALTRNPDILLELVTAGRRGR